MTMIPGSPHARPKLVPPDLGVGAEEVDDLACERLATHAGVLASLRFVLAFHDVR